MHFPCGEVSILNYPIIFLVLQPKRVLKENGILSLLLALFEKEEVVFWEVEEVNGDEAGLEEQVVTMSSHEFQRTQGRLVVVVL